MSNWEQEFRKRIDFFELNAKGLSDNKGYSFSIKIRVTGGCFHREHSPEAYKIIDNEIQNIEKGNFTLVEHESGPEILVFIVALTAGFNLAKGIIDLIITIIKARAEGKKRGDRPSEPLELIVRGYNSKGKLKEEKILRINASDEINRALIEQVLGEKIRELLKESSDKKGE